MKVGSKVWLAALGLALAAGVAQAQFQKPEAAIEYRKSVMTLIGYHFARMGAVVKGDVAYDAQAFAKDAQLVGTLIRLPWEAFAMPGSEQGDTAMKPAVFSEKEKFKTLAADAEADLGKLAEIAAGGDLDAIRAQFGQAVKSCKACHQAFRK